MRKSEVLDTTSSEQQPIISALFQHIFWQALAPSIYIHKGEEPSLKNNSYYNIGHGK